MFKTMLLAPWAKELKLRSNQNYVFTSSSSEMRTVRRMVVVFGMLLGLSSMKKSKKVLQITKEEEEEN